MNRTKFLLPWFQNKIISGPLCFDIRSGAHHLKYNIYNKIVGKIFYYDNGLPKYCAEVILPSLHFKEFAHLEDAKKFVDDLLEKEGYKTLPEHMLVLK